VFGKVARQFLDDVNAYVIALTLIAMPLFLGMALMVIDIGRGNNLHTELQNAVDSMALAGARELDGRSDAIARADAAIERLLNSAAFINGGAGMSLGSSINVAYDADNPAGSTVEVHYLKAIPNSDDLDIDSVFLGANEVYEAEADEAAYVLVRSTPQAMQTIFPLPVGLDRQTVSFSAEAVAVYRASACDVTPLYICNPFEDAAGNDPVASGELLQSKFADGELYGKQFEMVNSGNSKVGPGNFGFLKTLGNGAQVLANALAIGNPRTCYTKNSVETEPGAMVGPVEVGLNTRFGLYGGSFNNVDNDPLYRPAMNVRKGQEATGKSGKFDCKDYKAAVDTDAVPLGVRPSSVTPNGGGRILGGWDINYYFKVAHGAASAPNSAIASYYTSHPSGTLPAGVTPSAYDVYRYELGHPALIAHQAPNKETGTPQCYKGYDLNDYPASTYGDRREIFAAIVNCRNQDPTGRTNIEAVAFARMFMVKPVIAAGSTRSITLEMIDITGKGGRGTLDEFLREEAELVR
jgi:hypothetical protein